MILIIIIASPSGHPADLFVACALACLLACLLACVLTWWLTCLLACLLADVIACLLAWEPVGGSGSLQFAPGRPLGSSRQLNAAELGCAVGAIQRSHMVIPNDWLDIRKPVVRRFLEHRGQVGISSFHRKGSWRVVVAVLRRKAVV